MSIVTTRELFPLVNKTQKEKKKEKKSKSVAGVTDVYDITPWNGWCAISTCKLCFKGPFATTFEFRYKINQETESRYVSDACLKCTRALVDRDPFYQSREQWQKCVYDGKNNYRIYREYGLIDDFGIVKKKVE